MDPRIIQWHRCPYGTSRCPYGTSCCPYGTYCCPYGTHSHMYRLQLPVICITVINLPPPPPPPPLCPEASLAVL